MSDDAPHRNSVAWASRAATGGAPEQARTSDPEGDGPRGGLERLLDGNRRFRSGAARNDYDVSRALRHAESPRPGALVIGCIDSRVPPEVVFDQGVGDLLVVRTGGHVLDRAATASVQLAVTRMGIPLIVVLGHERCAAVEYAVDALHRGERPGGDLAFLVDQIAPSVPMDETLSGTATYEGAVRGHVASVVAALRALPDVAEAVASGTVSVAGLRYGITDGQAQVIVDPN